MDPLSRFGTLASRLDPGADRLARLARLYAVAALPLLLLTLVAMGWPAADAHHDLSGAPFGRDLSQVWVAGRAALAGHAPEVYAIAAHHRRIIEAFGPDAGLYSWHYPPVFLIVAAALALLPYAGAVLAWGLLSIGLIAGALRAILGAWKPVLVGLALPPVFECLAFGQNTLLTASLLAFGLVLSERRPLLAGLLLGLVCYKPQLAVAAPLLMLAGGRWRVTLASGVSAAAAVAASVALFGFAPWGAFLRGLADTNTVIFREAWGGLALNASAFGAVRLVGGSIASAWAVQITVAALAAAVALGVTLARRAPALRHAVLLAAIPLISPYVPVYDLAVLVPAGAFFVTGARASGGLAPGERLAILALAALSYDPRGMTLVTHVPTGFLLAGGAFLLVSTGAWRRGNEPLASRGTLDRPMRGYWRPNLSPSG